MKFFPPYVVTYSTVMHGADSGLGKKKEKKKKSTPFEIVLLKNDWRREETEESILCHCHGSDPVPASLLVKTTWLVEYGWSFIL